MATGAVTARTDTFEALRAAEYRRLDENGHVYLDYTGSGVYAESQLREHAEGWQQEGIAVWERWLPFFQETADLAGRFLHAESGSVIMHQNVSALFNAVLSCFDFTGSRNKIVYPELTFPTLKYNIHTRARLGARVWMLYMLLAQLQGGHGRILRSNRGTGHKRVVNLEDLPYIFFI